MKKKKDFTTREPLRGYEGVLDRIWSDYLVVDGIVSDRFDIQESQGCARRMIDLIEDIGIGPGRSGKQWAFKASTVLCRVCWDLGWEDVEIEHCARYNHDHVPIPMESVDYI